jgi:hypothetical protein
MLGRRRLLMRAAMVGGADYLTGRNLANRAQHDEEQNQQLSYLPHLRGVAEPHTANAQTDGIEERADGLFSGRDRRADRAWSLEHG